VKLIFSDPPGKIISIGGKPTKRFFAVSKPLSKKQNELFPRAWESPEPLRDALSGYWSPRIIEEHRFVYQAEVPSAAKLYPIDFKGNRH